MTPKQIDLARHALGLPNKRNFSFRNHFVAGKRHDDHAEWMAMVADGDATRRDGAKLSFGVDDIFHLTISGARKAILKGERLDLEDFATPQLRENAK